MCHEKPLWLCALSTRRKGYAFYLWFVQCVSCDQTCWWPTLHRSNISVHRWVTDHSFSIFLWLFSQDIFQSGQMNSDNFYFSINLFFGIRGHRNILAHKSSIKLLISHWPTGERLIEYRKDTCVESNNDFKTNTTTMNECWELCVHHTDFFCQLIEWVPATGKCILTKESFESIPESIFTPSVGKCVSFRHAQGYINKQYHHQNKWMLNRSIILNEMCSLLYIYSLV